MAAGHAPVRGQRSQKWHEPAYTYYESDLISGLATAQALTLRDCKVAVCQKDGMHALEFHVPRASVCITYSMHSGCTRTHRIEGPHLSPKVWPIAS